MTGEDGRRVALGVLEPRDHALLELTRSVLTGEDPAAAVRVALDAGVHDLEVAETLRALGVPIPASVDPAPWAEEREIELSSHTTRILRRPGQGTPLVLVHCVALDATMWTPLLASLPAALDVMAFDVRNHGPGPVVPFDLECCARDVIEISDVLGLDRIHLAGISMGGAIAQEVAIRHGDRLAALTLMATSGGSSAGTGRAEAGVRDGLAAQIAPTLTRWYTPEFLAEDGPWVRYTRQRLLSWTTDAWAAAWTALGDRETLSRLGVARAPTLCIAGRQDLSTPIERVQPLVEALPDARVAELPGGHLFPIEHPGDVAGRLVEFRDELGL